MNEHYTYDEIHGTLLYKNKDDTMRKYFCIECESYRFYTWMYSHGWDKAKDKICERNGLRGHEITLRR